MHINGLLHNMEVTMSNFTIKDMLAMQQALQEKYKDKWEAISPEARRAAKPRWGLATTGAKRRPNPPDERKEAII